MKENKTYSFDEAFEASLRYFDGDELAARVWVNKYAMKDSFGNIYEKSPEDMHWRIANEIARIEKKYKNPISKEEIFHLLDHFRYIIPAGSPMTGIGNNYQIASLSNCFVIGLDGDADSYGAILRIDEEQVQLMKRRGGVGHDLSHVRPKGSPVNNSALTSTGLVPFMERYSNSTREVAQDGRRGALMLSVSIKHPDTEAFVDAKMEEGKVTGANVSVKITDGFMEAAVNDTPFEQQFPIDAEKPSFKKEISAKKLWDKIVHNAWKSAEPGVLFWDTIIRESIPDCYADLGFRTVSTNPCGEIPLCPYDSCRLLSINLYAYVKNPFTKDATFDFDLFKKHAVLAQRLMDDIVDLEMEKIDHIMEKIKHDPQSDEVKLAEYHLWEKIKEKSGKGRRTGVGITAEGDMIAAMGLRYGTEEATKFAVDVHKTLALSAYRSSVTMAQERGAFTIFDAKREEKNPFVLRIKEADSQLYADMQKYGRRNIACLTIAPTGTTSLMTQTTSGIEPVFMPVYTRRRKVNPNDTDVHVDYVDEVGDSFEEYIVYHKKFLEWMKINGFDTTKKYTQAEINDLVKQSPYYKATANDVDWLMKVRMQGAIQKWVDHSISVTVNLPNNVDEALVNKLYVEAWRSGCKGCTIYRDGSRSGVMISVSKKDKKKKNEKEKETNEDHDLNSSEEKHEHTCTPPQVIEERPKVLDCDVVRFQNNKEKWVAFVGLLDGYPYEIFTGLQDDDEGIVLPKSVTKGKVIKQTNADGTHRYDFQFENKRGYKTTVEGLSEKFNPEYWNYAKLISGVLRYRMPIDHVIHLVGSLQLKDESINTWKNGVERALKKYVTDGTTASGQTCPVCGQETLVYQEGCLICTNCGASRCG
ncbi:adenosylcobalamin-dependent ribonucleoside-diphosphate reductase [Prevotella pallens]|jgi:ribonucleoside-diphosphate reductase, adenosylcobalamin-dependent|uniref:Vitamin B12-dependent ribonucleotide reductase n=2 Tax=Prevotella pallens TaxID=60133 RepID=A0ABX9DV77_9BACT|nr:adenosylcobalamin-dependent ribonucleoside-diphosphate reductase [Prevotella pallens]EGQ16814.1 ribonucleoside-diphosphate reductase [Prevotella pallens ATCC 700821]MBF1459958.1 adenosylcobalamin-dependent ribonucleoside-diphosphate reductase [Prevotella pallens]MBF1464867.1 adenosylcobalamin-dependent ribonucleoside-diphosphate reductase [Prevotella pallens]MBF1472180.1 adenosylcobalamin-dependent ribonucleoside-diphosphate reductase [Prevotella pallens]MBF1476363.1 adenosylcobalamin-depen